MDGWAATFGIAQVPITAPNAARDVEVSRLLGKAHIEMQRMRASLAALEVQIPQAASEKLDGLLSTRNLQISWQDVTGQYAAEAATALQMASQLLPADELLVPPEELEAILKEALELRRAIEHSDLPGPFKAFLLEQIETIERAIRDYPVSGAAAFRSASNIITGGWINQYEDLRAHAGRPEVQRVLSLGQRVTKAAKGVVLLSKVTDALLRIAGAAGEVASTVQHFLPPGAGPHA